jgi:hypothetical protein
MIMFAIKKKTNQKRLFNEEIWRRLKAILINQVLDIVWDLEEFCVKNCNWIQFFLFMSSSTDFFYKFS